jgi:hypothetical protein
VPVISKKVNDAQWRALATASMVALHNKREMLEEMCQLYCAKYGIEWPQSQTWGGKRKGAGRPPKVEELAGDK